MTENVCAYVLKYDSGLAPNPFHGICTLSVCTPNHMRSRVSRNDWIVGFAGAEIRRAGVNPQQWRLLYAMQVDDRLTLDEYYRHPDYQCKIPRREGTSEQVRGDNFYKLVNGTPTHTGETDDHLDEPLDAYGNRVFISRRYWYFGKHAPPLPPASWAAKVPTSFGPVPQGLRYLRGGTGITWTDEEFSAFQSWLQQQLVPAQPQPFHFARVVSPAVNATLPLQPVAPKHPQTSSQSAQQPRALRPRSDCS